MNKSALLHMIQHVAALSDQDVEELEKLVKNFPYCQTAHLLIAKASYDKGNMLSNQKLRKAAAYATNRHLLKKLIYTTDAAISLIAIQTTEQQEVSFGNIDNTTEILTKEEVKDVSAEVNESDIAILELATNSTANKAETALPENAAFNQPEERTTINSEEIILVEASSAGEDTNSEVLIPELVNNIDHSEVDLATEVNTIAINESNLPHKESEILPPSEQNVSFTVSEMDELLQVDNWASYAATTQNYNVPEQILDSEGLFTELAENKTSDATEIIRYELEVPTELEESAFEQTLANFDSYLFKPERDENLFGELKAATNEEFIREVYVSNQVGYWMGSSRLGELLQVKDELTHHTPLLFYPDLILEFSKQNYLTPTDPPKVSPVTRQFEIIDQFLKANPKLKAFSNEKVRSEPQDDLAFKSTKNTKNLASENLANILVQQGKIKKAIKIYEHLIVKIPEKRAYFASQIENLRNNI